MNVSSTTRNSSKATEVIFLDLSKAFNSVPHERLLLNMALMKIPFMVKKFSNLEKTE